MDKIVRFSYFVSPGGSSDTKILEKITHPFFLRPSTNNMIMRPLSPILTGKSIFFSYFVPPGSENGSKNSKKFTKHVTSLVIIIMPKN